MSTLALNGTDRHLTKPLVMRRARLRTYVVAFALGFPLAFYALLLMAVLVQYGHLPNYLTSYDWIANVQRIVAGTRSVADMVPIILDEWLIETGYMNYAYGRGIADWSLVIVPHKLVLLSLAGGLLGLNVGLLVGQAPTGTWWQQGLQLSQFGILSSAGASCASVTNATVFSVVHCAAPSWVGSLAVLGLDSVEMLSLEPYGPLIGLFGFAALGLSAVATARDRRACAGGSPRMQEGAPC